MSTKAKASGEAETAATTATTDSESPFGGEGADAVDDNAQVVPPTAETDADAHADAIESLAEARQKIAELEDRALRAAAEAENVRRRSERSIDSARKFALEKFVEDLLPAVEGFERAVEAASGDAQGAGATTAAMTEGIELSLKLLVGAMERHGIAVIDPTGTPFDPNLHEAVTMVDNAEVEPGSVVELFQKGYTVNGRLIRPARVIVARQPEPPKSAEEPTVRESSGETPAADSGHDASDT